MVQVKARLALPGSEHCRANVSTRRTAAILPAGAVPVNDMRHAVRQQEIRKDHLRVVDEDRTVQDSNGELASLDRRNSSVRQVGREQY